jgi:hypothetical protein
VSISRKEAFSFGLARKLLSHFEGTPLHMDMRSVLDKSAESLEGNVTIDFRFFAPLHYHTIMYDNVNEIRRPIEQTGKPRLL